MCHWRLLVRLLLRPYRPAPLARLPGTGAGDSVRARRGRRPRVDREKLLRRVMAETGLQSEETADKATRSVLIALTGVLSRNEADDMASELPREFKNLVYAHLTDAGTAKPVNWGTFFGRVQGDLGLNREEAERITKGVFVALSDAISPGEIEDVLAELPYDLQRILREAEVKSFP